jgi:DNA-binding SARP family transcriptional activator/predicted ATPase
MAHLSLSLLGPFQVTRAGEPVTGFEADKVRALLAYLVVEADRPHRRDSLVGLLWPDWPDRTARTNLRNALANLRKAIGDRNATPPFLLISRETIQFNTSSDTWVDVAAFTNLLKPKDSPQQTIRRLEEAIALYRENFLEGFHVKGSAAFEDWCSLTRERFQRQVLTALHRLAGYYEQFGEYERACNYAWRQVELEPWQEEAHRQLMRLLALSGQRSTALTQYKTCRRLLNQELGIRPAEETTRLYEQIRDGKLKAHVPRPAHPTGPVAKPPAFLAEKEPLEVERPVFVAREREMAQLNKFLDLALSGQGRVVFVTGEAGSGKTALIQEFTLRAQNVHADLVSVSGNGNAHTGIGDPYLPFRQVLELLTGDAEARWAAGAITSDYARRLWNTLPFTIQALVEAGPDLIDTFIPGTVLGQRALAYAPDGADWLTRLDELVKRKAITPAPGPQQSTLFEQYTRMLQTLARQRPLVLVLDDLQWADLGSISLLFHLGRQLAGSRILIVGAYRPEEMMSGRGGERHPLESVINEYHCQFGDITVNMDEAESQDFVEAFLDSEPNRLGFPFRQILYRQTRGHPLFAVELLRGLQERGDLVQDPKGRWIEGLALDWETFPPKVEGVIAERIGRLTDPLREVLRTASVEGETFTAEVVARVQVADEREIVAQLSNELDRRHRLVSAHGILRMGDQCLSQYRFRHILFQKYLYDSLDQVERVRLHEEVGTALEALYGEKAEEIAVQLARHFHQAGIAQRTIQYLHQAGNKAVQLSANKEAIAHFTQALELLETLPETPERDRQELVLQLGLVVPLQAARGFADPEVGRSCGRALELCLQIGETQQLLPALFLLWTFQIPQGQYEKALDIGKQLFGLAQREQNPQHIAMANLVIGFTLISTGEFIPARSRLEEMIAGYDPEQYRALMHVLGQDIGVVCRSILSWVLWFLGYPDQALKQSQEALALAQKLDHPFSLAFALAIAGATLHLFRREGQMVEKWTVALNQLVTKEGFALYQAGGTVFQGWVHTEQQRFEEGITLMHRGVGTWYAMGVRIQYTQLLAMLTEAYGKAGQAEDGLKVLSEALDAVEKTNERYYEAELHRLNGELLLMQDDEIEAEVCFHKAIEVARRQQAKLWELRTTRSLSRLWQRQGKREEARQLLAEIYDWFTEGFDTPDLKEAKALLEELS